MNSNRDWVSEIIEIKNRTGLPEFDNGITKLLFLATQTGKLVGEREENAYFLIASVSAIETYFRWEIQRLIDSGDRRYIDNITNVCREGLSVKINSDLLPALHGRRISVGALVAHVVRVRNLEAIFKVMGQLIGKDFRVMIKEARDPELRRTSGDTVPTIIGSIDDTLGSVGRTFMLRNVYCHEAHLSSAIKPDEVHRLCSACYDFVRASYYAIAFDRNPQAPLTLQEAYEDTAERVRQLEQKLNDLEKHIVSEMPPESRKPYLQILPAWKEYVEQEARYNESLHMNGNRGQLQSLVTKEQLYEKRLADMEEHARRIDTPLWEP